MQIVSHSHLNRPLSSFPIFMCRRLIVSNRSDRAQCVSCAPHFTIFAASSSFIKIDKSLMLQRLVSLWNSPQHILQCTIFWLNFSIFRRKNMLVLACLNRLTSFWNYCNHYLWFKMLDFWFYFSTYSSFTRAEAQFCMINNRIGSRIEHRNRVSEKWKHEHYTLCVNLT